MDRCKAIVDELIPEYKNKHAVKQSTGFSVAALCVSLVFVSLCTVDRLRTRIPPLAYRVNVIFGQSHIMKHCTLENTSCNMYRWTRAAQFIIMAVLVLCVLSYVLIFPVVHSYNRTSATLIWTSGAKLAQEGKVGCDKEWDTTDAYWVKTPGGFLQKNKYTQMNIPVECISDIKAKYKRINLELTTPLGCLLATVLLLGLLHFGCGPLWPGVRGAYCGRHKECNFSRKTFSGMLAPAATYAKSTWVWRNWTSKGTTALLLLAGAGALAACIYFTVQQQPHREKERKGNALHSGNLSVPAILCVLAALTLGAGLWRTGRAWVGGLISGSILIVFGILMETNKLSTGIDTGEGVLGSLFVLAGIVVMFKGFKNILYSRNLSSAA